MDEHPSDEGNVPGGPGGDVGRDKAGDGASDRDVAGARAGDGDVGRDGDVARDGDGDGARARAGDGAGAGDSGRAGAAGTPAASGRRPALSPSRASDFKACPLMFRLRAIDRIPEPPSPAAVRGTLVHAALERMFTLPAAERTEPAVAAGVPTLWEQLVQQRPELEGFVPDDELDAWFGAAGRLLHTYFGLEDPTRLEPQACELRLEVDLAEGVPARGFIDRLDVNADGLVRVVDYKTGRSPKDSYAGDAMFQLKFYALMLYRLRGVVPARLRLVYLGDASVVEFTPDEGGLLAFERGVVALWRAIERATATGQFPARRSRLCDWCSFQSLCPEFGGTPPPYPARPVDAPGAAGPLTLPGAAGPPTPTGPPTLPGADSPSPVVPAEAH